MRLPYDVWRDELAGSQRVGLRWVRPRRSPSLPVGVLLASAGLAIGLLVFAIMIGAFA